MAGEILEATDLGPKGIPGDRAWAVRDEVRGGIRGAKRFPQLMEMRSHYKTPPTGTDSVTAEIQFDDGSSASTSDTDINEKLSARIGSPVTLWPLLPGDALDHYRRGKPEREDMVAELRAIFGREGDEPLPDLSAFPKELIEYESPPGTYFDAYPLLLITSASLQTMQDRSHGSNFDVRRFRPNFLISDATSTQPFPELELIGRSLKIGTAIIKITLHCPRCIMTTHGFNDLPRDTSIMRSLVKEAEGSLGIYAEIEKPGRVQSGDIIELVD
jgi:uncharacterized protein YcbX